MKALQSEELKQALAQLSEEEVELFEVLIHDNVSENDYGRKIGLTQQGVSWKKQQIIKKLKKFLKNPFYYGLRRSEVLGIKWDAINYKDKKIYIRHKIIEVKTPNGKVLEGMDVMKTNILSVYS